MAKPPSTGRPSSRQSQGDGPQIKSFQPAPARATRSTRSQSREPSEPPAPRRHRRQESMESDTNKSSQTGARRQKDNSTGHELPPVAEDAQGEEPQPIPDAETLPLPGENSPATSVGRVSGISGTTAKTSFSTELVQELDKDVILDNLPGLLVAADDLGSFLVPDSNHSTFWKEVRTAGSRPNKLFKSRLRNFDHYKENFGGSQEYIQPRIILRVLLDVNSADEIPHGPWRPDTLIYKVNLAQMLSILVTHFSDPMELTEEGRFAISRLDKDFAQLVAAGEPSLASLDASLTISVHYAIAQLTHYQSTTNFSATEIIRDVLHDMQGNFKHADTLQLSAFDQAQQVAFHGRVQQALQELEAPFAPDRGLSHAAALGELRDKFSRLHALRDIADYYLSQRHHYDTTIDSVGGLASLCRALIEEVQNRDYDNQMEARRADLAKATPRKGMGFQMKPYIQDLITRQKRLSQQAPAAQVVAQQAAPPVPQMIEPTLDPSLRANWDHAVQPQGGEAMPQQDDSFQDIEEAAGGDAQTAPPSFMQQLSEFQNQHNRQAEQNRSSGFDDPQGDVQRVHFDESQQHQVPYDFQQPHQVTMAPSDAAYISSASSLGKRQRMEQDFDPSQDEGFQTAHVDPAAAERRRLETTVEEVRFVNPPPSGLTESPLTRTPAGRNPAKRARKNPGSSLPPPEPPRGPDDPLLEPDDLYARAKVVAKHGRIMASQNKPPQTRVPWSDAEERALLVLVSRHANDTISYTELKKIDETTEKLLQNRSAEDIRFKARNMKVTMLQAGVTLPPGWGAVKLGKKEIDKVRSRGIEFYQQPARVRGIDGEA